MRLNFARLVLSQSCSVLRSVVTRRLPIIALMLSLSSETSPRASTWIERVRSPLVTAVATSAIARTWLVRLAASRFTFAVRSFHVPATPGTSACPPSLPSVPTSRARRVTSAAKPLSWSTIVLMVSFSCRISPFTSTVILLDLRQRLTVESKGEVNALADTINSMTDTLAIFADQVTSVAREVGVEGRLGGQAHVPGTAGTWKDLTANVNLLAANLTNQVRAIAEVATAVTKGDLTRSIQVEARGEVSELKDNINAMIGNLRVTTERNTEQDWLKTNLAKFSRMMQGQRDLVTVGTLLLP